MVYWPWQARSPSVARRRRHATSAKTMPFVRTKMSRRSLYDRFMSKVDRQHESKGGCWIWTGCTGKFNYGAIWNDGETHRAHRISWSMFRSTIPSDRFVCHKCDNTLCVRPSHLFLGTHYDNMEDMTKKSRQATGERQGLAMLRKDNIKTIRSMYSSGEWSCANLAKQFGVSESAIRKVIKQETWRDI